MTLEAKRFLIRLFARTITMLSRELHYREEVYHTFRTKHDCSKDTRAERTQTGRSENVPLS